MTEERIHRAVSADGTEIAGRVRGEGPPLVLLHGGLEDGDMWDHLLPHFTDRFTCFMPSTRGRGLSGDSPDHSPPRLVEDVVAFVDSIGEPACLTGESLGATLALAAAAHAEAVSAVASYEPFVMSVLREDDLARFGAGVEQTAAAAAEGRLADAARAFLRVVVTDDELAAVEATDYFERSARNVPVLLREFQQAMEYDGPRATDPDMLGRIGAPVLLLRGRETVLRTYYADAVRYVAEHVPDAETRELPGLGHGAWLVAPERIADELVAFFGTVTSADPVA